MKKKSFKSIVIAVIILILISNAEIRDENSGNIDNSSTPNVISGTTNIDTENVDDSKQDDKQEQLVAKDTINVPNDKQEEKEEEKQEQQEDNKENIQVEEDKNETIEYNGKSYTVVEVDGGDLSGYRLPNVAVDVGFGDRTYWALTNEYGQLIHVLADRITLQDDNTEPVKSNGRYYNDEAKVPGTEQKDLDEGHVIADSLGGVSNAYNITPQNSTLNRHGDQAYMEKVIRDAGGCENFVATITYPDNTTQIPSKYKYEYVLKGNKIVDEFENVNPDEVNAEIEKQEEQKEEEEKAKTDKVDSSINEKEELSKIDTNGNGKVTIKEAKAAGYSMPIYSDHWLYKYMDDRDNDGMVGE